MAAKQSKWGKLYLLVLMAITTGARRGELMKLCWKDVNWEALQIFYGDTKNGSDKTMPLTATVMAELKRFRELGNGLIFASPRKASSSYDFRHERSAALGQAGILLTDEKGEKLVFHSLRHTFCSSLTNTGAELHEIAALAGHKSIQTTMRYTHTDKTRLASVVNNTFSNLG